MFHRLDFAIDSVVPRMGLRVEGEIDLATAGQLADTVMGLVGLDEGAARDVVLDLHAVTFLDSSAIAALVRCQEALEARGSRLVLTRVSALARRLFSVTSMDSYFTIETDADLESAG